LRASNHSGTSPSRRWRSPSASVVNGTSSYVQLRVVAGCPCADRPKRPECRRDAHCLLGDVSANVIRRGVSPPSVQ
jgi:hypothetical protein